MLVRGKDFHRIGNGWVNLQEIEGAHIIRCGKGGCGVELFLSHGHEFAGPTFKTENEAEEWITKVLGPGKEIV